MDNNEKVMYKKLVDDLKEIMGVNDKLPMVTYGRLKQLHIKYGINKLHDVVANNKTYLATRVSVNSFENYIHMWWYIDKIISTNIDYDDLDEYII